METRKYFEKVMRDYNQNRKGRNLHRYCLDESIEYKWLSEYKKTYSASKGCNRKRPNLGPHRILTVIHQFSVMPYKI